MNFLVCIIVGVLSVYFWYQRKYGERNKILAKISAPASWPLINHANLFFFKTPNQMLTNLIKTVESQPLVFRLDLSPFYSMILVHDVKIVETILASTKHIDKSEFYLSAIGEWLGSGLLISNGQKWHQRRKIITPTFHFKILEQFVEIMDKHGDVFLDKLRKLQSKEIDVFPYVSLYALDVICGNLSIFFSKSLINFFYIESAMGYELNSQIDGESEYANTVKE